MISLACGELKRLSLPSIGTNILEIRGDDKKAMDKKKERERNEHLRNPKKRSSLQCRKLKNGMGERKQGNRARTGTVRSSPFLQGIWWIWRFNDEIDGRKERLSLFYRN